MKVSHLLCAVAAVLASAACSADKGNGSGTTQAQSELPAVQRPADGDWSKVVTKTPEGGFLMGNTRAPVRLVEYASMTCPHCREFDEAGVQPLIDKYVKTGQVAYELRNYVRDGFDLAATLIARCNGEKGFFPLTRALFHDQPNWLSKLQSTPQEQLQSLETLPPQQVPLTAAKLAGFQDWAVMRGVPVAKSTQCLTNQQEIDQLVQMTSNVASEFPDFRGTPSFTINGKLLEETATWDKLEPQIRNALGERG